VVCEGDLEHVLGTVRAAELLPAVLKGGALNLRALLREPLFVPDSMPAFKLLEAFRASHRHLALVMDEFGAVEGLVSVADLLEGLVGALPRGPSSPGRRIPGSSRERPRLAKWSRNSSWRCRPMKSAPITRSPGSSWPAWGASLTRRTPSTTTTSSSRSSTWMAGEWTRS
jgi:hypothetical protein